MNYKTYINKDFRNRPQAAKHSGLRWLVFAAGCVVLGVVVASNHAVPTQESTSASLVKDIPIPVQETAPQAQSPSVTYLDSRPLALPEKPELSEQPAEPQDNTPAAQHEWTEAKVRRGENLSVLFNREGINKSEVYKAVHSGPEAKNLRYLHPGDIIRFEKNAQGELLALQFDIDLENYLQIDRSNDRLEASLHRYDVETRLAHASGEIQSSLFLDAAKSGLSQNLIMELANIFGWDIDFVLDIRQGDRFMVIYEEVYKEGEKIKDGDIVAAEFINQGKTYRALKYTNPVTGSSGYYSPDGKSMRKAFLRSPVNFSRISSRFTTRRYHPLLHKFRAHKGVDYAAKRGTPVLAAGDGKVIFRGRKGGYGNAIILQHGQGYTTLYGHLNNFNRTARLGSKVKQGQVIGYVGSTGLATGPHLHYEFRVNGVHRNPLTVKLPASRPIPKRYMDNFLLNTRGYVAQLDVLSRTVLALNN